jgi:hypothetical protein
VWNLADAIVSHLAHTIKIPTTHKVSLLEHDAH